MPRPSPLPALLKRGKNAITGFTSMFGGKQRQREGRVATGKVTGPTFPLVNKSDQSDSEWSPADRGIEVPDRAQDEKEIVDLVTQRFEKASRNREPYVRTWMECLAYARGNYYMGFDESGRLVSRKDPSDPYRSYVNVDLITPILEKLAARVISGRPDANVRPWTRAQRDVDAAGEARSILADCDREFERTQQTLDLVMNAFVFGTAWLKKCWEPNKKATLVTGQDPMTGEITGTSEEAIGAMGEYVRSPLQVVEDPKADERKEVGYMIEANVVSLTYVQDKFRDSPNAKYVTPAGLPDWFQKQIGNTQSALTGMAVSDSDLWNGQDTSQLVLLLECWEKPTERFPKGRLITIAGDRLVRYEDWPYENTDEFPYSPLIYHLNVGSIHADGLVQQLIPLQQLYNQIWSRILDRINADFPTIIVDEGAEIGVDAFSSPRNLRLIYRKPGREVEYFPPIPIPPVLFEMLDRIEEKMRQIAGVSVSDGNVPPGVTAAAAIESLQLQDNSQIAEFLGHLETFIARRANWEIALHKQYALEPRLIALSDQPGEEAMADVMAFRALQSGGKARVIVTPGSAVPKSAIAKEQKAFEWYMAGIYGPPQTPAAIENFLSAVGEAKSDQIVDNVRDAMAEAAELEAEMAQQEQEMKMATSLGQTALSQGDPEEAHARELEMKQAEAANQMQLDAEEIDRKAEAQMATDEHRASLDIHKAQIEAQLGIGKSVVDSALNPKPQPVTAKKPAAKKAAPKPKPAGKR